jgi:hypothetical protein
MTQEAEQDWGASPGATDDGQTQDWGTSDPVSEPRTEPLSSEKTGTATR